MSDTNSTGDEGVDVNFSGLGTLAEEFEDILNPAHELSEETIVMRMHLVDKFVEVVLMPLAEINERLNCLVRVCRDVLLSAFIDDLYMLAGVKGGKAKDIPISCRR